MGFGEDGEEFCEIGDGKEGGMLLVVMRGVSSHWFM